MNGIIVGIQTNGKDRYYNIITYTKPDSSEYKKVTVGERELVKAIANKMVNIANATVENGRVKGSTGDLNRFISDNGHKPMVILSEIVAEDKVIGYRMAAHTGVVKTCRLKDALAYCARVHNAGIPIQNAMYVPESGTQKAHIRAYPGQTFYREVIQRKKAAIVQHAAVNTTNNEKQISKIDDLFNKEQIEELRLGKKNGVNIKIYGNNELSAAQMREIRKALEAGVNAKLFADPAFSVETMQALRVNAKYGVDLKFFINPKFNAEQIYELSTGYLSGVDISKYANPKLTARQMAKERIALENQLWREVEAVDGKLN